MAQELYELPGGWEWKELLDVVSTSGFKVGKIAKKDFQSKGSLPIIDQSQNYIAGYCESKAGFEGKLPVVVYGDHTNSVKHIDFQFVCGADGTKVLAPNIGVFSWFLYYALLQFRPESQGYRRHFPILKQQKLPLPPLNEQKRIVAKLDALFTRIDTAITHLQQTLELSKALFASAQLSIFDGLEHAHQVVRLDGICTITSSKRIFKSDYVASGTPFFRTKEVVELSNNKGISTELFISNEKFEQIKMKFGVPKEGDLLFSAVGTIGVTWVVDDRQFYFKDGNLLWLKDFKGIDVAFLRESITAVLAEEIRHKSQGAAYKAISIKNLKDFQIPLPPITEQKRIVNHLNVLTERVRTLEAVTQKKLNDLNAFKASLLDAAFKGQL